jgi:uncharacterized membrane protein HdeD (DUF308 family)
MANQISKLWYMPLLKGIIMILLAILIFMSPGGALLAWVFYIGIGLLLTGVVIIYMAFSLRSVTPNWGWKVFEGVIDIFLAFVLLANPAVTASVLPFVIGFWGAFYGIMLFADGISEKGDRGIKIISGILIFLISTTIMFNPLLGGMTFAIWFGILVFIAGIYNIIAAFGLKKIGS